MCMYCMCLYTNTIMGGFATLSVWCTCRIILKHFLDILKLIVWFEHLLYFAVLSRDWLSQRPYERPKAALCCSKKGLGQRLAVERKAVKRAHAHSSHSLRIFRKVAPTICTIHTQIEGESTHIVYCVEPTSSLEARAFLFFGQTLAQCLSCLYALQKRWAKSKSM